ncbi:aldo/keto reductase [Streptomyces avicenniae]|uniref:aldo/keto reductase n=1 Tax=Streptomyces avicenniae TaxID=500153 RepID=UPI00069B2CCD|nr:aldo/keto reductase [Streptomyces avicenniae]
MAALDHYRTLGRTGLRISPLALGTMTFGDPSWGADDETSAAIIDRYLDQGGNFLDSANGYTEGRSERVVGEYLRAHPGLRDRLVIATKFAGNMHPGDPNGGGAGRKAILHQVNASLERLGTDYIDLYWQHNWDRHTPLEETVATLDDLVRAGKVRYFGLSDTPAWAVTRAATVAEFRGWAPVAAIQVEYSLLQRTVENELFGAAHALGLGVTPWSPLAGGVLTGKYTRDNPNPSGAGRSSQVSASLTDRTFDLIDGLGRIGERLNAPVAAVSLAWVRQQAPVTATIIGARRVDQLDANLASLDVTLSDDDLAELDRLSTPELDFPADFLIDVALNWQQAGTTINGVRSEPLRR